MAGDQGILKNLRFLQMLWYLEGQRLWPSLCFIGLIQNRFGLFAIAMPISIKRPRDSKMQCAFPCRRTVRTCKFYNILQGSEDYQHHFIGWWLIARELIDHGANAVERREVCPDARKFIAKYIKVTESVAGYELNASPMSYLEWPQYMQLHCCSHLSIDSIRLQQQECIIL